MSMTDDFISYLKDQIGQPYVWGGQHTKLTPENYVAVIRNKEKRTNKKNWEDDANEAIAFCKKKFDDGATVLYAYDYSGLGCYWLYNLKHLYSCDVNANTMMSRCDLKTESPKKGWWVFRLSGRRASHIGYMIDDQYLVEAKGRKYGAVRTKFRSKDWACWGIPNVFKNDIEALSESDKVEIPVDDEDGIITPDNEPQMAVEVIGNSVNVRDADNVDGNILFTAHSKNGYKAKGINHDSDMFCLIDIAPSGWYHIMTYKGEAYITNKEKYTKLVEI